MVDLTHIKERVREMQVGFDILLQSASSGARVGNPATAGRQDGLVRALQELGCRHLVKAYLASIPEQPAGKIHINFLPHFMYRELYNFMYRGLY